MKKILLGIVTTIVVLAMAITNVNAANVGAPTEIEKGKSFTVTINLDKATEGIDVKLTYPNTVKYTGKAVDNGLIDVRDNNGTLIISAANSEKAIKQVSLTFTAEQATDAAQFKAYDLDAEPGETLANNGIASVKITEGQQAPVTDPEDPTDEPQGGDDTTNVKEEKPATQTKKVDDAGKEIKKIPQAGVPYIVLGLIAVAVIAIIVAKKLVK